MNLCINDDEIFDDEELIELLGYVTVDYTETYTNQKQIFFDEQGRENGFSFGSFLSEFDRQLQSYLRAEDEYNDILFILKQVRGNKYPINKLYYINRVLKEERFTEEEVMEIKRSKEELRKVDATQLKGEVERESWIALRQYFDGKGNGSEAKIAVVALGILVKEKQASNNQRKLDIIERGLENGKLLGNSMGNMDEE